jgi:hypothetical protein
MREWCGCGAAIRARRSDVLTWRKEHTCPPRAEDPPGQYGGGSDTQINQQQTWLESDVIGFRPNAERRR